MLPDSKQINVPPYARAEVTGLAVAGNDVWLATNVGLYSCRRREFIAGWRGRPLRAIAPLKDGLLLAAAENDQTSLFHCNAAGRVVEAFPNFPNKHVRCVAYFAGPIVGGKQGVFRLKGDRYLPIFSSGNVIRLEAADGQITAFLKGQGPEDRPAVAVSADGGQSWRLLWEGEYADQVQAARGDRAVTRWRHLVREGEPSRYQDLPAQAAYLDDDGGEAILAGPELTIRGANRATVRIQHPSFVDAEHLAWCGPHIILAGRPGAWQVEPATGAVSDLFADDPLARNAGRIKQVFSLGGRRFLLTTTSATFVSVDAGEHWRMVDSDWGVHHAKAVVGDRLEKFHLICKGGLFQSDDNGASWKWQPVRPRTGHFGELTGGLAAADCLILASKRGLLVPSDEPGTWDWFGALAAKKVKLLQVDAAGRILGAIFDQREIHAIEPASGKTSCLAVLPEEIQWVGTVGRTLLALTHTALYRLDGSSPVKVPLPTGSANWHGTATASGMLIWNEENAWINKGENGQWRPVAGWPPGVKKLAVSEDGGIALWTDGSTLARLDLSRISPN